MHQPKVSIIVPVYNGAKFIENTLQMILRSSLPDIEVIVIDDGSKDNSISICKSLAAYDRRIKLFCQKNTGVFGARNHGLHEATGEFVCFCDQDDAIEPNIYQKMYFEAKKNSCNVIMTGTGKLIGQKKEIFEKFPDVVLEGEEIWRNCMIPVLLNGTACYPENRKIRLENDIWKCMIERAFILENKIVFRHFVNYEDDLLFLLDILARAQKVLLLSDTLYYWRINLKSETYHTAYVEDLYAKDRRLQKEIMGIMRLAGVTEEYIELYRKYQNCTRYIHIIENESKKRGKKYRQKMNEIRKAEKEPGFHDSLKMRHQYKNNLIRRKILLSMMDHHLFAAAYWFHKIYDFIRKGGLHLHAWVKIENYLYEKG